MTIDEKIKSKDEKMKKYSIVLTEKQQKHHVKFINMNILERKKY